MLYAFRLNALRRGDPNQSTDNQVDDEIIDAAAREVEKSDRKHSARQKRGIHDNLFSKPDLAKEQLLIDAIIDAIFYYDADRERIRKDPLVRLLIPNPPGNYHFAIVTAMGVITEGKKGLELEPAFRRLKAKRDVTVIRADTGTARSLDYNAAKIEDAIGCAIELKRPYGLLGYSQGCANALQTESLLLSGMSDNALLPLLSLCSPRSEFTLSHSSQALLPSSKLWSTRILVWYADSFYFPQRMALYTAPQWI